jgi:hypothetical protein
VWTIRPQAQRPSERFPVECSRKVRFFIHAPPIRT